MPKTTYIQHFSGELKFTAIEFVVKTLIISIYNEPTQKLVEPFFYGCVIISLITGLIIELGPKELKKPMEEIHVLGIYYLVAFIGIHIGGVLLAEFTYHKGIISSVISGRKK